MISINYGIQIGGEFPQILLYLPDGGTPFCVPPTDR